LVEFIGTRNCDAVKSHAQKHFIKLFRLGLPLPPKVVETGAGYTLSGSPLDPESAAAKPYLSRSNPKLFAEQPGFVMKQKEASEMSPLPCESVTTEMDDAEKAAMHKLPGTRARKKKRQPLREENFITHDSTEGLSRESYKKRLRRQTCYKSINFSQLTAEA
jgi:hypothetical protein